MQRQASAQAVASLGNTCRYVSDAIRMTGPKCLTCPSAVLKLSLAVVVESFFVGAQSKRIPAVVSSQAAVEI